MNCKCKSYNNPEDYQTDESVILNILTSVHADGEELYDEICIDKCIADDIKGMMKKGITTLGSCCGHNTKRKSVVVSPEDAKLTKGLYPEYEVLSWKLIEEITALK